MKPSLWFALTLLMSFALPVRGAGLFDGADSGSSSSAKLAPGKEVQIRDADVGGRGYYTVYLPSDYDGHRLFPIVFFYHDRFDQPGTTALRQISGGAGFILIGMEYTPLEPAKGQPVKKPAPARVKPSDATDELRPQADALRRVAASLRNDLKIDPKQMFIGGFGQGGVHAQAMALRTMELWAGVIVFGAGMDGEPVQPAMVAQKPYLFAVGETDAIAASAKQAADAYRKLRADVTFETFPGKAHEIDTHDAALKQWLINYGPHRQVYLALHLADEALKENHLGDALMHYQSVAQLNASADEQKQAREQAQALSDKAAARMAAAEQAIAAQNWGPAAEELVQLSGEYAGSEFGTRADQRLKAIQSDPIAAKAIIQARLDGQADLLESQGIACEQSQDYPKAITIYELYLAKYPNAHHAAAVQAKLAALQSNKTISADMQAKKTDADCRSWFSMADNCIASGDTDKARAYLHRIIDTYASTSWADQARAKLKQLGE